MSSVKKTKKKRPLQRKIKSIVKKFSVIIHEHYPDENRGAGWRKEQGGGYFVFKGNFNDSVHAFFGGTSELYKYWNGNSR